MLYNFLTMIIFAVLTFSMIFIGKVILDKLTKKHYDADITIEKEDNFAIALRRGGFYFGIAIAMTASILPTEGLLQSIIHQTLNGSLILMFLFMAMWSADKIVLKAIDNTIELKKGNISVGLVEAGLYISTGLIAYASFKGEDGPFISGIVFFILGQIMLFGIGKIYGYLNKDIFNKIYSGNISAGLIVSGIMIAYAIILKTAICGEFVSWESDIQSFFVSAVVGILMLLLFANKVIDNLFLPTSKIEKEIQEDNYAAIFMIVSLKIAIALIIATVVI